MRKWLVQASDYGFTRAVTYGAIDAVDLGLVRNVGLFVNMPSTSFAVDLIKQRDVCLGMDFNITNGPCVSDPKRIPHLVDEEGNFIRSSIRVKDAQFQHAAGRKAMFPLDECLTELKAQLERFVALVGKYPAYLHDHSLTSENYVKALRLISKEYRIPYTRDVQEKYGFKSLAHVLYPEALAMDKTIDYERQANKQLEQLFWDHIEEVMSSEYVILSGHAAYIDDDLLRLSSCSIERCKDAALVMSPRLKEWVKKNHIALITYHDLEM